MDVWFLGRVATGEDLDESVARKMANALMQVIYRGASKNGGLQLDTESRAETNSPKIINELRWLASVVSRPLRKRGPLISWGSSKQSAIWSIRAATFRGT